MTDSAAAEVPVPLEDLLKLAARLEEANDYAFADRLLQRALAAALHPGANRFTHYGSFYIPRLAQIKDDDRQIVVHTHRNRRRVHHLEVLLKHFDIGEMVEAAGYDNAAVQRYSAFSPFGIDGGFYYARLSYKF